MSNPISTSPLSPNNISTTKKASETTGQWIARHNESVCSSTPVGNTLTTTWTSSNGPQSTVSNRKAGESDREFIYRHMNEFLVAASEEPPIP